MTNDDTLPSNKKTPLTGEMCPCDLAQGVVISINFWVSKLMRPSNWLKLQVFDYRDETDAGRTLGSNWGFMLWDDIANHWATTTPLSISCSLISLRAEEKHILISDLPRTQTLRPSEDFKFYFHTALSLSLAFGYPLLQCSDSFFNHIPSIPFEGVCLRARAYMCVCIVLCGTVQYGRVCGLELLEHP